MKDGETKATGNPFYGGATPEEVVRALLRPRRKEEAEAPDNREDCHPRNRDEKTEGT